MRPIDYAIVGGGVSGTYCAWRLQKKYRGKKKIELFEYSDRIGGRLLSLPPEQFNNIILPDGKKLSEKTGGIDVVGELGGMRYLPHDHKIFAKLIEELKLEDVPFPMGDGDQFKNGENNLAYFRHTWFRISELKDFSKLQDAFPKLAWLEKNLDPDQLQYYVMKTFVPNYENLNKPEEWGNVDIYGKKLYQFGFWNLLYRVLSPEAYTYLKYGSGYDTNVSNGNAAVLLPTGEEFAPPSLDEDSTKSKREEEEKKEPPPSKFRTLKNGLQALPKKLADEYEEKYKGVLKKNHRLRSIEKHEGKYILQFIETETIIQNGRYITVDTGQDDFVLAENVILGMPRAALEQIVFLRVTEDFSDFLRKNLSSVLNQPAMKILLVYEYAWWKSLGILHGRSITDLPIRQTLYFTSENDSDLKTISNNPALLLASYNDIETIPFWKGLAYADPEKDEELFPGPKGYQAPKEMVKEANDQIEEMHDFEEMLKPMAAAFFDWSEKPFSAGWHCWKANCKYWDVAEKMLRPDDKEKVYICGDAYSFDQGWSEGALETAERVLTKKLDEPLESIFEKEYVPHLIKRRPKTS